MEQAEDGKEPFFPELRRTQIDNPYRYAGYEYIEEVELYDLNASYITKKGNFDYSLFFSNCVTTSIEGLQKGTLSYGKKYSEAFPYETIIPKFYKNAVKEQFDNASFVKE